VSSTYTQTYEKIKKKKRKKQIDSIHFLVRFIKLIFVHLFLKNNLYI
jgi:hypothetical protein